LLLWVSCEEDFEELNTNPFQPTQVEIGPLFNSVIESMILGWSEQLYLHNEILYKITQQAALTAPTFQNVSVGTEEVWNRYYLALADIRDIQNKLDNFEGEQETMNNVRAMLKTALAYKTFRLIDLFGGIPFFDAGKGFEGLEFIRPAFDSQESIYKFLLEDLQWVNENANVFPNPMTESEEPYVDISSFDKLFDGDMLMWVKFANSLRLRHAVRMYEKDPNFASAVIADVLENQFPLVEVGEDVGMWPSRIGWLNEGLNWSFREHNKIRMGSNIWNLMSAHDSTDGSGIFDKRVKVFFETNNADEWVPFPQIPDANTPPSGGTPYQQVRDANFGVKGSKCIFSPVHYYMARDESYLPELFLTASEVKFLKAEIYLRGMGVAVDESLAKTSYKAGVTNSIKFWYNLVANTPSWTNAVPSIAVNEEFSIYNHPNIIWTDGADYLNLIYTQRWIDAFRQPWEAYSLGRRTSATPIEGERSQHYRFVYPPSEVENNPDNWAAHAGTIGGDVVTNKVWWMP